MVEEGVMAAWTVSVLLGRVHPGSWTDETLEIHGQNMEMQGITGSSCNTYIVLESCRTYMFYYVKRCDMSFVMLLYLVARIALSAKVLAAC